MKKMTQQTSTKIFLTRFFNQIRLMFLKRNVARNKRRSIGYPNIIFVLYISALFMLNFWIMDQT